MWLAGKKRSPKKSSVGFPSIIFPEDGRDFLPYRTADYSRQHLLLSGIGWGAIAQDDLHFPPSFIFLIFFFFVFFVCSFIRLFVFPFSPALCGPSGATKRRRETEFLSCTHGTKRYVPVHTYIHAPSIPHPPSPSPILHPPSSKSSGRILCACVGLCGCMMLST